MEQQLQPFTFSVLRILDSVFWVEEAINAEPEENIRIGYGLGIFYDIEENWAQYNITAQFSIQDKIFATGTVVTKFGIQNLKAYADPADNSVLWPKNVLETMFGIAFSHTRALMAKNISGTKFSKYIIPLVNPAELFQQLMIDNPNFEVKKVDEMGNEIP